MLFLLSVSQLHFAAAQEPCYPAGGVAGIVIATFVVTVVLVGLSLAAAWRLWKRKKGAKQQSKDNHVTADKVPGDFAFDNPYFREQEDDDTDGKGRFGVSKGPLRSSKQSDLSNKGKKNRTGKNHFIFGGGGGFRKQRALDDSCLAVEPERTVVSLRGHDFTGLGFNICGNMRDGILVKDVLHRGPASESGRIKAGDRIMSVTVSFANIVYEDALTILSYASPYDVQLELERIPEKSRTMQQSPSGSKRLGSCSFSGGGQKLFHPLYRSQSIDDLTQIDKDTFPSHGLGPRRSQSVGVAAHKLASHFKNSDTMLEERNRSSASVILSTTGSLNEKMLANVMVEGGLQKSGFQWEKRFEDTLDSESSETNRTSGLGDSKRDTPALTSKSQSLIKESLSSAESDRSDSSDEIPSPHHYTREKHKYHGPMSEEQPSSTNRNQKNINNSSAIKTTAQIHRIEGRGSRKAKEIPETVNGMWHLEQCMRDGHAAVSVSDIDITNSQSSYANRTSYRSTRENLYPSSSSSEIHRESNATNTTKGVRSSRHGKDEDSDVSHDSLEMGGRKGRNKRTKRRSSSLGDVTQLEEAVNDATSAQGSKYHNAPQKFVGNDTRDYKIQDPYQKALNSDFEPSELSKTKYNNNIQKGDTNFNSGHDPNASGNPPYINSGLHEQKLMRSNNHQENSPNVYMKSSKPPLNNPLTLYKENNAPNVQSANRVNAQAKPSSNRNINAVGRNGSPKETRKDIEKLYYSEKYEINSSRNFAQSYGSNDRVVVSGGNPNPQLNKAAFQQRPSPMNHHSQLLPSNTADDMEHKRVEVVQEVPSSAQQHFVRKAASPAGMFTQISPFHQPSRHKNNANFKPWTNKEDSRKDVSSPANGNVTFHPHGISKSVTSCDSSSHQRQKRDIVSELSPFAHRTVDGDLSKTVIMSTFDNSAGRSSVHKTEDGKSHPANMRQTRK